MRKAAGLISLVLLAGCQAHLPNTIKLDGSEWRAVVIDGQPAAGGVRSTLAVTDGRVAGFTGCNQYSAEAKLADDKLEIGQIVSTRRACDPTTMNQERQFLGALEASRGYRLAGNELYLLDADGNETMKLVRAAP